MNGLHENGEKYPALILDDESDHSSLNTKRNKPEGSEIHKLIGNLRDSIPQNAYIGYTATPQAVLLSDPKSKLFPEDFFWLLEPHDKYFGPMEFFNEYSEFCISTVSEDEFPNYNSKEVEQELEKKEKSIQDWQASEIEKWLNLENHPISVNSAVIDFILTGSIKWWREGIGDDPLYPDHSMIFHLDRRNVCQNKLGKVINKVWENCIDRFDKLIMNDFVFNDDFEKLIEQRWERLMRNIETIRMDPKERPKIKDLEYFIRLIIDSVGGRHEKHIRDGLRVLNSKETNELPYQLQEGKGRPPKALIVIGGDLLSRGVTIEGLTVSYYMRLARTPSADTELQRCRWFGAKRDYRDLLTLHIQPQHQILFKDLADHNEDLMHQAKEGIIRGYKPDQILILMAIKESYQATSRTKSGKITKLEDSYSGNATQFMQPSFKKSKENNLLYHNYLETLGRPELLSSNRGKIWTNVDSKELCKFLENINFDVDAPKQINPKDLSRYFNKWIEEEEEWSEFPTINVVQRYGKNKEEISEAGRVTDGANGVKIPRMYFKNLAAGMSKNFSSDWHIDATNYDKDKTGMNYEKYEKWFEDKTSNVENKARWDTKKRRRKKGAPILIVFYKLNPRYIGRKRPDGVGGKWFSDEGVVNEYPLVGFIANIPIGGPRGGGIINSLMDMDKIKIVRGRVLH